MSGTSRKSRKLSGRTKRIWIFCLPCLLLFILLRSPRVVGPSHKTQTADIVVSFCSKKLDWLKKFVSDVSPRQEVLAIFVYSKCAYHDEAYVSLGEFARTNSIDLRVIPEVNNGQNDGTYIQHIVQNYGRLAEVTYFLKDSMDKYPIKKLRKLSVTPTEASIALRRGADFVCFRRPDASGYQAAYEWHLRKELWQFRLPEYITADRYASKEVEKDYVPSRLTFCRFLSIHLSFEELNRLGKADYIKVCYGGAFATQKSSILSISFESWLSFASALNSHRASGEMHYMERTWASILAPGLIGHTHKYSKKYAVLFRTSAGISYPGMIYDPKFFEQKMHRANKVERITLECSWSGGHTLNRDFVVLVTHNYGLEGAPNYLRYLSRALIAAQKQVIFIGPSDGPLMSLLLDDGVYRTLVWENLLQNYEAVTVKAISDIVAEAVNAWPAVIVFNTVLFARAIASNHASCASSPRVVWFLHEWAIVPENTELRADGKGTMWYGENIHEIEPKRLRFTTAQADAVVFVSEAQRDLWQHATHSLVKTFTIPGYAQLPKSHLQSETKQAIRKSFGIKKNTFVLSVVGTVCRRKRQEWAVLALNALLDRGIDANLLVVGKASRPSKNYLLSTALDRTSLHFISPLSKLDDIWKIVDLHVSSSQAEVFPLNTLEAMVNKVPVVATDVGGTREQFLSSRTRAFVATGESDSEMLRNFIQAVLKVASLNVNELRQFGETFAEGASTFSERFAIEVNTFLQWLHVHSSEILECGVN